MLNLSEKRFFALTMVPNSISIFYTVNTGMNGIMFFPCSIPVFRAFSFILTGIPVFQAGFLFGKPENIA